MTAGRETYTVPMSKEQAEGARDALAMLLYSRLFDWLVAALNDNIAAGKKKNSADPKKIAVESFIGVLDIYGFESFQVFAYSSLLFSSLLFSSLLSPLCSLSLSLCLSLRNSFFYK